jgi:proteasome alpha subunit
MQTLQHQQMGYDRAITMFSPDGRLLQVEYAKKTVKQGSTAIGITTSESVILITDKRVVDNLVVPGAVEKIFQIDDHIIATAAGIIPDARVLVERAQVRSQQHFVTYDTPIEVISVVKDLTSLMQLTTQSGGYRPFGVSMLIAGVDRDGVKLYVTDPVGVYNQYRAAAIGERGDEAEEMLRKEWKATLTHEEGLKLAFSVLKRVLAENLGAERIDGAYIKLKDAKMQRMTAEEIAKHLK